MRLRSLKTKLLIGVCLLVISSGALISLLVTDRYSRSLHDALSSQVEHLADALALQVTDMVLTNDLVGLQNTLDHQVRGNASLSYLLIVKNGEVLAHTFQGGVPIDLLAANAPLASGMLHLQEITSTKGEHYLDAAVPIFEGKAGILRLGYSEKHYRRQVTALRMHMALFTLGVLLLSLAAGLLFIRRITDPLTKLVRAAEKVEEGKMDVRVKVEGQDEVAALAGAFNHMLSSLQSYTQRLEEQTMEIERSHHQTRTFCGIVQEIGSLRTLKEIGAYLIDKFRPILECGRIAFIMISDTRDALFIITDKETINLKEPGPVQNFSAMLDELNEKEEPDSTNDLGLMAPFVCEVLRFKTVQTTIPLIHEKRTFGALVIAGSPESPCGETESHLVRSMLSQAAGVIRRAMLHEEEIRELQSQVASPTEFCGIISKNHKMQTIFQLIENIAPTDTSVLIQSDSGTGKELVARAIHNLSPRKDKPLIVIDCSAYPATLLESELFGHEKGAFTGAIRQKAGRFELADGGTVFLDEIGEIPFPAQIKLLRVLQTHQFERLGGEKTLTVNVRVIAATNRNLLDEVKKGGFREDLYYRLNVIPIHLPPLRQRRNDIPLLALHFLGRFAGGGGEKVEGFSPEAMRLLLDYSWPGNVRELENSIEHAAVLAKGRRIDPAHLPAALNKAYTSSVPPKPPTLYEQEASLLREAMEDCGWNKKEAARRLGISRSTLYEKLRKYGVTHLTAH
ncbi:MAG: sigma 54-interacting transcriptional regulator [Syntrophobacteraceae bacterium]|nr:sigma 54-interacting transcriptional regulator [Syntrophobacteraceae bacterium]